MQTPVLVLSLLLSCFFSAMALRLRRSRGRQKVAAEAENSLWMELSSGLFELDDAPAATRMEITLAAISRKLGLRAGIVTRHNQNICAVIAGASENAELLAGLGRGSVVARNSVFCGSVHEGVPSLAIDYASLSEWRRHSAQRERGWESYLGVACGTGGIVVSFFDSRPRPFPFTRAERALVEQLGPWISAMVAGDTAADPTLHPVLDAQREL